jgi:hypothetical protein
VLWNKVYYLSWLCGSRILRLVAVDTEVILVQTILTQLLNTPILLQTILTQLLNTPILLQTILTQLLNTPILLQTILTQLQSSQHRMISPCNMHEARHKVTFFGTKFVRTKFTKSLGFFFKFWEGRWCVRIHSQAPDMWSPADRRLPAAFWAIIVCKRTPFHFLSAYVDIACQFHVCVVWRSNCCFRTAVSQSRRKSAFADMAGHC